jgi:hypothetical protein
MVESGWVLRARSTWKERQLFEEKRLVRMAADEFLVNDCGWNGLQSDKARLRPFDPGLE